MTVLELIFNIEYSETENYDKYYYLWSITDNGLYMYFTFKEDIPEIEGIRVEEIQYALWNISDLYDNDELFLDEKQTFVPYEYLKPYIDMVIILQKLLHITRSRIIENTITNQREVITIHRAH